MRVATELLPFKLGRRPSAHDPRTLRLAVYTTGDLPKPPAWVNWLSKVEGWPLYGNDRIGDCEPAACAHLIEAWSTYAGAPARVADEDVVGAYSAVSGYDPTSGEHDDGVRSLDMLNHWRRNGIGGHHITAYVSVNVRDHHEVRAATHLFGGLLLGIDMPLSAAVQTRLGHTWRHIDGDNGRPGSWGGHAVHLGAYDARSLTCTTWGRTQRMDWRFWDAYVVEAYAIASPQWINTATGAAPVGLNLAALLDDLHHIH